MSFLESEMTDAYQPGYIESLELRVLLGRMGDPAELAATLVWLASDAGGFVTGQTIVVDGGVTIT
jgi:NAD(P)-dependent dehydrogenase (short-subunit alcohol dehydrogenase family)